MIFFDSKKQNKWVIRQAGQWGQVALLVSAIMDIIIRVVDTVGATDIGHLHHHKLTRAQGRQHSLL